MTASQGRSGCSNEAAAAEAVRTLRRFFMSAHITWFLPAQDGARKIMALPSWACSSTSWHLPKSPHVLRWKPLRVVVGSSGTRASNI